MPTKTRACTAAREYGIERTVFHNRSDTASASHDNSIWLNLIAFGEKNLL